MFLGGQRCGKWPQLSENEGQGTTGNWVGSGRGCWKTRNDSSDKASDRDKDMGMSTTYSERLC